MTALCDRPDARLRLGREQLRERKPPDRQAANPEEVATVHAVAIARS